MKFSLSHPGIVSPRRASLAPPNLNEFVIVRNKFVRKPIPKSNPGKLRITSSRSSSSSGSSKQSAKSPSVIALLGGVKPSRSRCEERRVEDSHEIPELVSDISGDTFTYISRMLEAIDQGRFDMQGKPWVWPTSCSGTHAPSLIGSQSVNDVFTNVCAPILFVWAPTKFAPWAQVRCPICKGIAKALPHTDWTEPRTLQTSLYDAVFVASRHVCSRQSCARTARAQKFIFSARTCAAVDLLPQSTQCEWTVFSTGNNLYDASFVDMARALATRASWNQIANVVNESRSEWWSRNIVNKYAVFCDELSVQPEPLARIQQFKVISQSNVKDVYFKDFTRRVASVVLDLLGYTPGDVLAFDWTKGVAKRCGGNWMFNAMDDNGIVLASVLTRSTWPEEVAPIVRDLKLRGASPIVIYVDNECCGTWRDIVAQVWPDAVVRLDGFHAINRLTKTVVYNRHPWYKQCQSMPQRTMYILLVIHSCVQCTKLCI